MSKKKGLIFIISGPSGSGKTTLLKSLLASPGLKNKLFKSVSLTTRPKRTGERSGRDYFFITQEEFMRLRRQKKILEWTRYLGYYYATPKDTVERYLGRGLNLALCLDLKGALRVRRLYPGQAVTIFIAPPSLADLRQRIEGRCRKTTAKEVILRLKLAGQELLAAGRYDYRLVNRHLKDTTRQLAKIVLAKIRGVNPTRSARCPT